MRMGNTADLQLSPEDPVPPSAPSVAVDVTVTPVLSYALAQHAVPVVSRVTLTSADRTLRGATLRSSVQDAEGAIGTVVERPVDLAAGRTTVLDDVDLALDPAAMLQVEERRPGWVRVELESEGELLVQRRIPVHVLAATQWLATPLPLALDLLAAHVQPDHPAVTALPAEAAALLEEGTGSGELAGCAGDPERVDEVVEAITWAMRRREIRATESPSSWTDQGQQVRTPGEVLDGGAGTSLDTVVTLAAACERAGIRPLLWVVSGGGAGQEHAFFGYWRGEGTPAGTDVAALVDLVDQGLIRLVETTLLTDRGDTRTDLHGPAYAWLSGDLSRVLGVTDVHRARQDGVLPLPAVEPLPATDPVATAPGPVLQETGTLVDPDVRDRLLDVGGHSGLPLTVPSDALPVLEDLVGNGTTITLLPGEPTAADRTPVELTERRAVHVDVPDSLPRLRELASRARSVVEETGANDLYLALGSLVWEHDGRPLRSPLVLLPVVLSPAAQPGAYRLTADESGAAELNECLLAELRRLHGFAVPGLDAGLDLAATLDAVRAALAERSLPWQVEATADLAVLPLAQFRRLQDLDAHGAELAANPLV